MKIAYIDLETTGLGFYENAITQLALIVEINGEERERINLFVRPDEDQEIEEAALRISHISYEELVQYPNTQKDLYELLTKTLKKYINVYDADDKFYLVGYNIHSFDMQFLRMLFLRNKDQFIGSYFHNPSIDVMLVSAFAAIGQRHKLHNFKLMTVAKSLGIDVEEDKAHDAMYDVEVTREIFKMLYDELGVR